MASVKITYPYNVYDGIPITFRAPGDSTECDSITLNSMKYDIVDANGASLAPAENVFSSGAYVTVTLDTANAKAYILNAAASAHVSAELAGIRDDMAKLGAIRTEFDSGTMATTATYSYTGNLSQIYVIEQKYSSSYSYIYTTVLSRKQLTTDKRTFYGSADSIVPHDYPCTEAYLDGNGYPVFKSVGGVLTRVVGYY
ncbi:MAG: hypothetical protein IJ449_11725 [Clostridia bacterium]|nr:hypothetical protein [Clostridia bacterium]